MPSKKPKPNTRALAEIFRALSSEPRLAILAALASGPMSVLGIADKIKMGGSSTSQHLAKLRSADIVDRTRDAQTVRYYIASPMRPAVENALQLLGKG